MKVPCHRGAVHGIVMYISIHLLWRFHSRLGVTSERGLAISIHLLWRFHGEGRKRKCKHCKRFQYIFCEGSMSRCSEWCTNQQYFNTSSVKVPLDRSATMRVMGGNFNTSSVKVPWIVGSMLVPLALISIHLLWRFHLMWKSQKKTGKSNFNTSSVKVPWNLEKSGILPQHYFNTSSVKVPCIGKCY